MPIIAGFGRPLRTAIFSVALTMFSGMSGVAQQLPEALIGSETPPIVEAPPRCGTDPISIARMQWPSSIVLAYVHALILEKELDCEVQVVAGDLVGTASSMATTGQPAIAPEVWVTRIAQIWNSATESQRLRPIGSTFSSSQLEGWFVPTHLIEHLPSLSEPSQLADVARQLVAEEGVRLSFISCPPDWACSIINRNLIAAYGLADLVDIIEPANRFELDTLIAQSVSRSQPVFFYYWQPNSVLAQFEFRALSMGAYNPEAFACLARRDCADPQVTGFVAEPIFIVVPDWLQERAPQVAEYLIRASMPLRELNAILAWQAENSASFEEAAAQFVATRSEIWRPWLPSS